MKFITKSGNPENQQTACVVVAVFQSRRLSTAAKQLDKISGGILSDILLRGDMEGETGDTLMLYNVPNTMCERILLVGCGKKQDFNEKIFRKVNQATAKVLQKSGTTKACSFLTTLAVKGFGNDWKLRQAVVSIEDALYVYDHTKSEKTKPPFPLKEITLMTETQQGTNKAARAIAEGEATANGASLAKDLGNLPANICTPSYLADQAKALKGKQSKLNISVIDEAEMTKLGMGALLAVSRGSDQPSKLIILEYRGADKKYKPVVLVGKGITFDSGGISIKPSQAMDEMKFDMCGAASVLGTVKACAEMELPINVVGLIASAENMPGGRASKPGDIITTLSGQTVEILNTDAEGRLVLCDALSYAERYKPDTVIDIATLTGACIVALGQHPSGLMSNHDALARELLEAGNESGDRVWQLPLWDDYQEQLDSNFADMANIGGRYAGAITAGCFLARFTKNYHWAHLDIAGTAWNTGKEKGATGRPVPLLTQFLMNRVNSQ
jgi:leucyl aminopeptidase